MMAEKCHREASRGLLQAKITLPSTTILLLCALLPCSLAQVVVTDGAGFGMIPMRTRSDTSALLSQPTVSFQGSEPQVNRPAGVYLSAQDLGSPVQLQAASAARQQQLQAEQQLQQLAALQSQPYGGAYSQSFGQQPTNQLAQQERPLLGDIALAQQVQPVTVMQPILAQPVLQERPSIALALQPELTSAQQQPILQQERPVPEGITLSIQPQPQPSRTFPLLQASDFNSNPADAIFPFFEELAALAPAMQPESAPASTASIEPAELSTAAALARVIEAVAGISDAPHTSPKGEKQLTSSERAKSRAQKSLQKRREAEKSLEAAQAAQQEEPSLTIVQVEQSLSNPGVANVEVVTLTKKQERPGAKAMKSLAKRPEDASADAAAAAAPQAAWKPAAAHRSTLAPVEAPSAAPSIEPSKVFQNFQEKKAKKNSEKVFQRQIEQELQQLKAAPSSDYETIWAPGAAPSDQQVSGQPSFEQVMSELARNPSTQNGRAALAPAPALDMRSLVLAAQQKDTAAAKTPAAALEAAALPTLQVNRKYGGDKGASIADVAAAPAQPRPAKSKKHITDTTMYAHEALAAATHPAVIWQSHLLDVTPADWPSLKSSYISGIAQGANVDPSWVSIVGVTSSSSVTVNTQIVYQDDNKAAAKELASSLTQAQSAPIYVPNFGQVQVTGITQVDSPIIPQFTSTSSVSWTGTSVSALGPSAAAPQASTVYAPPLQPGASLSSLSATQPFGMQSGLAADTPVVKKVSGVYQNNGLPTGAAIGLAVGVVVIAAALLVLAHFHRKRTERYIAQFVTAPNSGIDVTPSPGTPIASKGVGL